MSNTVHIMQILKIFNFFKKLFVSFYFRIQWKQIWGK